MLQFKLCNRRGAVCTFFSNTVLATAVLQYCLCTCIAVCCILDDLFADTLVAADTSLWSLYGNIMHVPLNLTRACVAHTGERGVLNEGWHRQAEAVSTALHPDVDQLVALLNRLATTTEPIFSSQSPELKNCIDAALCLPEADFKPLESDSLHSILLEEKLKWVPDRKQFAARWGFTDRALRAQLPDVRKAITQWQHAVVNHWEATGYQHNAQGASHLKDQRPVRVHINGVFIADALDSADLACIMLHTVSTRSGWSSVSQAIKAPGHHVLTISRYCPCLHCIVHLPTNNIVCLLTDIAMHLSVKAHSRTSPLWVSSQALLGHGVSLYCITALQFLVFCVGMRISCHMHW